jgi:hypothetical protein
MPKKPNIRKEEYENLYDCIRTDQVIKLLIGLRIKNFLIGIKSKR